MARARLIAADLSSSPGSEPKKVAIAREIREKTTVNSGLFRSVARLRLWSDRIIHARCFRHGLPGTSRAFALRRGAKTRGLRPGVAELSLETMNHTICFIAFAALGVRSLMAVSPLERELAQMREERDKAVAAATDPINRRYQSSLEQLLRRATQTNDLDTANKIKAEMTGGAAEPQAATQFAGGPRAIEKALPGQWNWEGSSHKTWGTFVQNGEFRMDGITHGWKVSSNGTVTVTRPDKTKATFQLSSDLKTFTGTNFDGQPLSGSRRQ